MNESKKKCVWIKHDYLINKGFFSAIIILYRHTESSAKTLFLTFLKSLFPHLHKLFLSVFLVTHNTVITGSPCNSRIPAEIFKNRCAQGFFFLKNMMQCTVNCNCNSPVQLATGTDLYSTTCFHLRTSLEWVWLVEYTYLHFPTPAMFKLAAKAFI